MSWSLRVTNGDLSPSPASLEAVTGAQKLVQDLRLWILERMGTDDLHPAFGSLIDGGITPEGNYVEGVIGTEDWRQAQILVESEIRRITREYQLLQLARAKNDRIKLGRATLSSGEVLQDVSKIDFRQEADSLIVSVTIVNGDNASLDLDLRF